LLALAEKGDHRKVDMLVNNKLMLNVNEGYLFIVFE